MAEPRLLQGRKGSVIVGQRLISGHQGSVLAGGQIGKCSGRLYCSLKRLQYGRKGCLPVELRLLWVPIILTIKHGPVFLLKLLWVCSSREIVAGS